MKKLKHIDIAKACQLLCLELTASKVIKGSGTRVSCYPVPRGGIPIAYRLKATLSEKGIDLHICESPDSADFILDDIIDSGSTRDRYRDEFPAKPFVAAFDTTEDGKDKEWLVFPWEETAEKSIEDNIIRLLQYAGDDPSREGLQETPTRVAKALKHWFNGYDKKPEDVMKVFTDGGEKYDQMVIVKNIPIYSKCEHHMADIFGTATIAYIPDGKIVGLSKLSRLADLFARRLQVQERLTDQIAQAIQDNLKPRGVGVMIKARHMCMESRGICQQGHHTITTALKGVLLNDTDARSEFIALAKD